MQHLTYGIFFFALGACIGSFLNVVVWRLQQIEFIATESSLRYLYRVVRHLSDPPSHCPKCNKLLKWYDNLPVVGWIKLGGKCRFCKEPISKRYPIIEAVTGAMFLGYYLLFFVAMIGPCVGVNDHGQPMGRSLFMPRDVWLYLLDMALLSGLLACSLIDAESFMIPIEIPWLITIVALIVHPIYDTHYTPGNLIITRIPGALAAGAGIGTLLSYLLWMWGILPKSFAEELPLLEIEREALERKREEQRNAKKSKGRHAEQDDADEQEDPEPREWSAGEIRKEISKEMLFLLPPLGLGFLAVILAYQPGAIGQWWVIATNHPWVSSLLGCVLGGLVGGFVVWITRILGSLAFGREAMGLGDVHLMVAVGAVLGAGPATAAFFLAPFFGIALAIYMLLTGKKRELPYGPYLSLATAFVMLFYCPIAAYFAPGVSSMAWMLGRLVGGGG